MFASFESVLILSVFIYLKKIELLRLNYVVNIPMFNGERGKKLYLDRTHVTCHVSYFDVSRMYRFIYHLNEIGKSTRKLLSMLGF